MKNILVVLSILLASSLFAGNVQKTFTFGNPEVKTVGVFQTFTLDNTKLMGKPGEPMLPWHEIALMLPPGEAALSITITGEELTPFPGSFNIYPQQHVQPISKGPDGTFIKNETVYNLHAAYPAKAYSHLTTQYLNGYAFALSTFTPVVYNPGAKSLAYYRKVTVNVTSAPDPAAETALLNLTASENALKRVRLFTQNPEMINLYPVKRALKTGYQILIITPSQFVTGFQPLIDYYSGTGLASQVKTTQDINTTMTGQDLAEKIRNYIIQEYQTNGIDNVILGGDVAHVPYRGFYCLAISQPNQEDYDIPSDIYFSALDGNWNTNGNNKWGEPGEDDLLPEIAVGRMSFSNAAEQTIHVHKSVSYQGSPVLGELNRPLLVGEFLYDSPMTFGQDYLELLVNDHTDNGYFTHGVIPAESEISRLYDTVISPPSNLYSWDLATLLADINTGKSFIHHSGHSNSDYMMRLNMWDITNANFSKVNGIIHNYTLMYTHGCICGAFDNEDCIAEKSININNFLVAGVFNSRFGWFDQGLTEGPSAHLHREFVSAMYNDTVANQIKEIGAAHTMSKIKTAPWVGLPGEFEPGAQRWVHYDCNVLGDPAMKVWTDEPTTGISEKGNNLNFSVSPNPCRDNASVSLLLNHQADVEVTITNCMGQPVFNHTFSNQPAGKVAFAIPVPSVDAGIYFCRILAEGRTGIAKLIVVK